MLNCILGEIIIQLLLRSFVFIIFLFLLPSLLKAGDSLSCGEDRLDEGIQHYISGEFDSAGINFGRAAACYLEVQDTSNTLYAYKLLGAALINQERHPEFLAYGNQIGKLLVRSHKEGPALLTLLGTAAQAYGDHSAAHSYFGKALEMVPKVKGYSRLNLGDLFVNIGKLGVAEADYDHALLQYQHALQVYRELPDANRAKWVSIGKCHLNRGRTLELTGEFRQSMYEYQKVKILLEKHPHLPTELLNYNNLAIAYRNLALYDSSLYCLNQALELQGDDHPKLGRTYKQMGETYLAKGKWEQAQFWLLKALALRKREYSSGKHPNLAKVYLLLGNAGEKARDSAMALNYYQRAIWATAKGDENPGNPDLDQVLFPVELLRVLPAKLHLLSQSSLWEDRLNAHKTYVFADQVIGRLRFDLQMESSQLFLSAQTRPIYEGAIDNALTLHAQSGDFFWIEAAFRFAERSKAEMLGEALRLARVGRPAAIPDSVWRFRSETGQKLAQIQKSIALESSEVKLIELQKQNFLHQSRLDSLQKVISAIAPEFHWFGGKGQLLTMDSVKNRLAKDQALIEYFVGKNQIYAFFINPDSAGVMKVGSPIGLAREVEQFLGLCSGDKTGSEEFSKLGYLLQKKLLAPLLEVIPHSRLIIVADDQLHLLPFELLPTALFKGGNFRELPYLFRKKATCYQFSASLIPDPSKRRPKRGSWLGLSPDFGQGELVALPSAHKELVFLENSFGSGEVLSGAAASRDSFLQLLSSNPLGFEVIHLATHASADLEEPARSWIAFQGGDFLKNRMYLDEIYQYRFETELSVLSACKTGAGTVASGEGVLSLSRAFYLGGSAAVLNNLWQASDHASVWLMERFYKGLARGEAKDIALQKARIAYLERTDIAGQHLLPRYWGALKLVGSPRPLRPADGNEIWWILGGVLILILNRRR